MATKLKYQGVEDQIVSSSLHRQAIINGNFDVWQRGTSFTGSGSLADRWYAVVGTAGRTITRQSAELDGSMYCMRIARDESNTSTTSNFYAYRGLESNDGIKFRNKKVTISFYARAGANYSPTDSNLLVQVKTGTGTDESFTSGNYTTGNTTDINENQSITTTWTRYSFTSANELGATITQLSVLFGVAPTGTAGASDYVEITQVQLCAGDVALPFQPKSFEEELRACMRYYEKSFRYTVAPAENTSDYNGALYYKATATTLNVITVNYLVPKRIASSTFTTYNPTVANANWKNIEGGADVAVASKANSNNSFRIGLDGTVTAGHRFGIHWTADAEL